MKVISMLSHSNLNLNLRKKEDPNSILNASSSLGKSSEIRPTGELQRKKINIVMESPNLRKSLVRGAQKISSIKEEVFSFNKHMKLSEILENDRSVEVFMNK